MELLIVVAVLAALAMVVLPHFSTTKKMANDIAVQSELAEIQRAFIRFKNDCMLTQDQYDDVAKYGVSVLMKNRNADNDAIFTDWDDDKGRGWRGPYLVSEGMRRINPNASGQPLSGSGVLGGVFVPVICCPDADVTNTDDIGFYRIFVADINGNIAQPDQGDLTHIWLVYPYFGSNIPTHIPEENNANRKYWRLLTAAWDDAD